MKQTGTLAAARTAAPAPTSILLERLGRRVRTGTLVVETPAGERLSFGGNAAGGPQAVWQLNNLRPLWAVTARGALGLAESYLAGDWDTPDLTAFLGLCAANEGQLGPLARGMAALRLGDRVRHWLRRNSPRQARENISFHYDLGNDFYAQWLDPSMTYSSALFADEHEALETAQARKYSRLADLAGVREGSRVLEIGCGWGGFMEHAAVERGASVTGVSISAEQVGYARARMSRLGVSDRATVEFRDYRDLEGSFEHIVSIEMFEAVGEAYWDTYASKLAALLAPDGQAALQLITIDHDRFDRYRRAPDFIQRYVFPGGMLPSIEVLEATLDRAGLVITDRLDFGLDYARTLACWREQFDSAWPAIVELGFDERFQRLWHYYLAYCETGFRHGSIDVVQVQVGHRC
ncbi:MAG: class I SAM-dependent methyltransferase [Gammaproteobacteria bacterium]